MSAFEIPTVNYPEIASVDEAVDLLNEDKELMANRILDAINQAQLQGQDKIDLFRLCIKGDVTYIMRCHQKEWEMCLENAKKFFERNEEYEKCSKIVDLLESI